MSQCAVAFRIGRIFLRNFGDISEHISRIQPTFPHHQQPFLSCGWNATPLSPRYLDTTRRHKASDSDNGLHIPLTLEFSLDECKIIFLFVNIFSVVSKSFIHQVTRDKVKRHINNNHIVNSFYKTNILEFPAFFM